MLHSTVPERRGNKEKSKRDSWMSLGRRSRSKLGAGDDGNIRDQGQNRRREYSKRYLDGTGDNLGAV